MAGNDRPPLAPLAFPSWIGSPRPEPAVHASQAGAGARGLSPVRVGCTLRDMKITHLSAVVVRVPQKPPIAPYQSRYRATSEKEALIVRLQTDTGLTGWGETPIDWLDKSFEGAPEELLCGQAVGRDPFDIEAWYAENTLGSDRASG